MVIITAFLLGLLGSFHCAGMCGPLALSLPLRGTNIWQKLSGGLLYNLGRSLMYGAMGAGFGLIGQGFNLLGFQRWISIAMGIVLLLSVFTPFMFRKVQFSQLDAFSGFIRKNIQKLFQQRFYGGLFLIGSLNSLLPCGLVYLAIAGAVGVGNIYVSAAYMVAFGLGTLPMMLAISLAGNIISMPIRSKISKAIPYVVCLVGIIFILRGLCLGIPFLSPSEEKLQSRLHPQPTECVAPKVEGSCCHGK